MDDKQRHQVATGTGLGVSIVALFLPIWFPKMSPELAKYGVLLGIAIFMWGMWPLVRSLLFGGASAMPSVAIESGLIETTEDNDVSLSEAAREALEAIEGSVFSVAARRPFNAPNGALCFIGERLVMDGMPIYGKQVPSSILALVGDNAFFGASLTKDATVIEDDDSHRVTYTNLMVKRSDLEAAIASLKARHLQSST
ncbi:hypothetical protein LPN04_26570 [Rugamonas sp. A1-17]|nr:hypothetical protein [Rugamonas sp. A1-17]